MGMHLGSKLLETDNQSEGELEIDPDSQTDLTVETNQGIDVCYVYEYKLSGEPVREIRMPAALSLAALQDTCSRTKAFYWDH